MTVVSMWQEPAGVLIDGLERSWAGLWSLLDATGHAALTASLAAPLGIGVDLAFAAIELGEARDELEWTRPEVVEQPSSRLGPVHVGDDLDDLRDVLEHLVHAARARALHLADEPATPEELGCLGRVLRKVHAALDELTRVLR